jgi:dsDNA-specific endonuclease/ATPase MutS2
VVGWRGQVIDRAKQLMDKNVLKVTELIRRLEEQRDLLEEEMRAAKAKEEVSGMMITKHDDLDMRSR